MERTTKQVKPVPMAILRSVLQIEAASHDCPTSQVMADLITIAFYFLLESGEYCSDTGAELTCPFKFKEIQLFYYG